MPARIRDKQWDGGFTLIEILVVAVIMGLLIGGGLASYARFHQKRQVEEGALHFASQLRVVQKQVDSGQKPISVTSCTGPSSGPLDGYSVNTAANRDDADVLVSCGGNIGSLEPISLRAQYSNVVFGDVFLITFLPVSQGVQYTNPGDNIVVIRDVGDNYRYEVEISNGGAITVKELP